MATEAIVVTHGVGSVLLFLFLFLSRNSIQWMDCRQWRCAEGPYGGCHRLPARTNCRARFSITTILVGVRASRYWSTYTQNSKFPGPDPTRTEADSDCDVTVTMKIGAQKPKSGRGAPSSLVPVGLRERKVGRVGRQSARLSYRSHI